MAEKSVYLESCVLVHYIENSQLASVIEETLEAALRQDITVVTSVIAIAEVNFAERERSRKRLDPEVTERINALWNVRSPIRLVEVSPLICFRAHELLRQGAVKGYRKTRAHDAIHLVSAQTAQVDEFFCTVQGLAQVVGSRRLSDRAASQPSGR